MRIGYFGEYLNKQRYSLIMCWDVIVEDCPVESERLNYSMSFMNGLMDIYKFSTQTVDCPINSLLFTSVFKLSYISLFPSFLEKIGYVNDILLHYNYVTDDSKSTRGKEILTNNMKIGMQALDLKFMPTSDASMVNVYRELCGDELAQLVQKWIQELAKTLPIYTGVLEETISYIASKVK